MIISMLIAVLVVSAIAAFLAAVLAVAEYYLANYGPCQVTINDDREVTVQGGKSLLSSLVEEKIFIPSACGGRGTCGLCKVKVLDGAGPLLPTEEPFLDQQERESNMRLSCQVKVRNDLKIEVPAELLAVREYQCRCAKIVDLTHDIKLFRFELIEPETIDYVPGQFVQLLTPAYGKSREEVYRAYSIASDPAEKNVIELIIRLVPGGICTTYCFEHLKEGDDVRINGPYGDFRLSETQAPAVFIAGGSGMAPIKCILHHMKNTASQRRGVYFFGANGPDELFMTDLMRQFESELPDYRYVPVVARPAEGDGWEGETGLVTEAVPKGLANAAEYEAYLCGSPGMIDAAVKVLIDLGVAEDKVFYDKFAQPNKRVEIGRVGLAPRKTSEGIGGASPTPYDSCFITRPQMKQSPKMQKLEEMLRSSVLVVGGFMGSDGRPVTEVVEADAAALSRLGVTAEQLAHRMREITDAAIKGLGTWVAIGAHHEARVDEARGWIPCPWSDGHRFRKRVTTVRRMDSGLTVQWSDLGIHFIGAHTFFEGKGSFFRVEPPELVNILF